MSSYGTVYLIGAGPGAVDLITVRGARLLGEAGIVFYDALVDEAMLKEYCPQAQWVAVGKRCGKNSTAQSFINRRLLEAVKQYAIVVRLKGGDPLLFGRADEEISTLEAHNIPVHVVPGVTAALAGAAGLKQSLSLRGVSRSVAFITQAVGNGENVPSTLPVADTLVFYMGRNQTAEIAQRLLNNNWSPQTPVRIVEAASTRHEKIWATDLQAMSTGIVGDCLDGEAPTLLMVGEALRGRRNPGVQNISTIALALAA